MKRRTWLLPVLALVAAVGLAVAAWTWLRRGEPAAARDTDPRLTFATPFRNVRPDVNYVGDATCAACHPDQAEPYRRHPMGRSFAPVSHAVDLERYDEAARNPFEESGFQFLVRRQAGRLFHQESR